MGMFQDAMKKILELVLESYSQGLPAEIIWLLRYALHYKPLLGINV